MSASFKRSLRRIGVAAGSARDRSVAATIRSVVQSEVLPGPLDAVVAFGTGRAFVRRVPRENLWIWYQVAESHIELLAVKNEPAVPLDE